MKYSNEYVHKLNFSFVAPEFVDERSFISVNLIVRGCSQIMSAKNGGVYTPLPPFVSHCQNFPD